MSCMWMGVEMGWHSWDSWMWNEKEARYERHCIQCGELQTDLDNRNEYFDSIDYWEEVDDGR